MKFIRNVFGWMKRHKILSLVFVCIIVILFFIFRPKPALPPATQVIKKTNLIQSVSVSGAIAAKKFSNLSFISSGLLTYIGAQQGDTVTAGQTIATIDQRTIQENIQNAVKAYQNQKISFDTVNDFNGDRTLSDTGLSISARRQLETAVNTLDQAKIALEIQQIARDQSILTSPINGILTRADVTIVGQNVTAATVFSVVDPSSLVFAMDVDEADIGKVVVGQPVKLTLDAYPDVTLDYPVSHIDFVSHTTTNGGNAFTVEVKVASGSAEQYRVGMNGNAEIVTAERDNILTVPSASVVDNKYVYVKTTNGYEKRNVTLGLQNDVDAEVISGLQEGDMIVVQPDKIPKTQKK